MVGDTGLGKCSKGVFSKGLPLNDSVPHYRGKYEKSTNWRTFTS